ncbi:MAG: GNAT family N-acetyltransferase [Tractidigestivibacter sp.]|jgi:RimJ/RimL family protein N-acetyltransferase|uniref:GNAT family N-acetyltransferase n=1 Tax=Tractidigestivibacter sp. TaxID=2847320 RepID=UPI003D8E3FE2
MPCSHPIRTARLVLRPWREDDAQALYRHAKNPDVGPAAGWKAHSSLEESKKALHEVLMVPECYAITIKSANGPSEPVGAIALSIGSSSKLGLPDDEAEIGYWISEPYWNDGYMTEAVSAIIRHAFMELGLNAVWAGYYRGNERSRRVQEKAGMKPHHTVPSVVDSLGVEHAENVTRLTRAEWELALSADPTDSGTIAQQQAEAIRVINGMPLVSQVRSGGQTGADRGGLDAARAAGVPICGWCPPGGLAEDLPEPPGLLTLYPELKEGKTDGYVERTAWNVRDSHATLIVSPGGLEPKSGTEMTVFFARRFRRPVLVLEGVDVQDDAARALKWLKDLGMRGITLNVAGPRESKMPGVYALTKGIVSSILAGASRS